jgi:hypothetical protein
MNAENLTSDEEKILNLLLLLSEKFESKAYPMRSPWVERVIYRVQALVFRW